MGLIVGRLCVKGSCTALRLPLTFKVLMALLEFTFTLEGITCLVNLTLFRGDALLRWRQGFDRFDH